MPIGFILLGFLYCPGLQRDPFEPLDSVKLKFLSAPDCAQYHQEGPGPPSIFDEGRVSCVWAGLLSCCPETPAWICVQGSHHAFP